MSSSWKTNKDRHGRDNLTPSEVREQEKAHPYHRADEQLTPQEIRGGAPSVPHGGVTSDQAGRS